MPLTVRKVRGKDLFAVKEDGKTVKEFQVKKDALEYVKNYKPQVEEPKVEEPKVEEPKVEELKVEELKVKKTKVVKPKVKTEAKILRVKKTN